MTREEAIRRLAKYYGLEPEEESGEFDLDSYDWTAGCGDGEGRWISLANVIHAIFDEDEEVR